MWSSSSLTIASLCAGKDHRQTPPATQLARATKAVPAEFGPQQVPICSSTSVLNNLHVLNGSPSEWKNRGVKITGVLQECRPKPKWHINSPSYTGIKIGKIGWSVFSRFRARVISLLIKKGTISHDLPLSPRSDNSKFPSGWCLGSFITGLSYFWCLIIFGGGSYTIGSHSSLFLIERLLTTSRREKNKIKTHSAEASDGNWKKPKLRMGKERVSWDVGCVWESLLPGSVTGWPGSGELQEYTSKTNTGIIKWERPFIKREDQP